MTRIPHGEDTKKLVQQLCNKNWNVSLNTIGDHKDLWDKVKDKVTKRILKEISAYLKQESNSLLCINPDEAVGFLDKFEISA